MADNIINLIQEVIDEDLEAMREVVEEDIVPIIKYQEELERKSFEKAYEELKRLEEEV